MTRPYIGITGFMKHYEAEDVVNAFPSSSRYALMVGVLASQKTMRGIQNKWPNRYPAPEKIREIFPDHPNALNLIHYNTKEPETLCEQLLAVAQIAGPHFHGFQINVAWPDPRQLALYAEKCIKNTMVLQIGGNAFEMVGHSPKLLADRVQRDYPNVDYLLLDPSGGYGELMDFEKARTYLEELLSRGLQMKFGVAGGLSNRTLPLLRPLAEQFLDLSIDAEGRLRDEDDNLDLYIAQRYADKAMEIFGVWPAM